MPQAPAKGSKSRSSASRNGRTASKPAAAKPAKKRAATARKPANSRPAAARKPTSGRAANVRAKPVANDAESGSPTTKGRAADGASGVAEVARKAKTPLIAGGATVAAGVAGAIALAVKSKSRRKVLGVPVGRGSALKLGRRGGVTRDARKLASAVTDAAKRADRIGQDISRVATTVQHVSETADKAAKKA
jgi:hypothetical protein